MIIRSPLPPRTELDAMIARAEAACSRYRRDAAERGLSPFTARNRRDKCHMMEQTVARLRAQRAPSSGLRDSDQTGAT